MRRALLLAVVLLGLAACGGGEDEQEAAPATTKPAEAESVSVQMNEVNRSRQSGTATLTATGEDSYRVVLELSETGFASQPAHVHEGTCAEYAQMSFDEQVNSVRDSLTNVAEGKSTTNVGLTPLASRTTGGFSINVHDPASPFPATACGDIPAR